MNTHQAAADITAALPELTHEVSRSNNLQNPFALIRILTRYTQKMVQQHNTAMAKKCMTLIGRIYTKGDLMIKHAVEDVFVYSMDRITLSCTLSERNELVKNIPAPLYQAYLKQVYTSGM